MPLVRERAAAFLSKHPLERPPRVAKRVLPFSCPPDGALKSYPARAGLATLIPHAAACRFGGRDPVEERRGNSGPPMSGMRGIFRFIRLPKIRFIRAPDFDQAPLNSVRILFNWDMPAKMQPGQAIARGVCRHLRQHDFASLEEFTPVPGLRVDVIALGPKGELWIVECKSSRADYRSDTKWKGYLEYCDRFFWAVTTFFPIELLPPETGIIVADAYDAEIVRMGPECKVAASRRRKLTLKFARNSADRLHSIKEASP